MKFGFECFCPALSNLCISVDRGYAFARYSRSHLAYPALFGKNVRRSAGWNGVACEKHQKRLDRVVVVERRRQRFWYRPKNESTWTGSTDRGRVCSDSHLQTQTCLATWSRKFVSRGMCGGGNYWSYVRPCLNFWKPLFNRCELDFAAYNKVRTCTGVCPGAVM